MKLLTFLISSADFYHSINIAWKGYLALFIAMAILFGFILLLNFVTNIKKDKQ